MRNKASGRIESLKIIMRNMVGLENMQRKKNTSVVFLPGEAIKSLRLELGNIVGEKLASGVLFRFGFRCGEALVEKRSSDGGSLNTFENALTDIWKQTGLGTIEKIDEDSENEIKIVHKNSTEARVVGESESPSCDFTRGYLAGITSKILKKKFYCVESECEAAGDQRCSFQLVVFPHRVYVPKSNKKNKKSDKKQS
jgi:predicted hydrocarbon binding protein